MDKNRSSRAVFLEEAADASCESIELYASIPAQDP
jgi:hypothetical protein